MKAIALLLLSLLVGSVGGSRRGRSGCGVLSILSRGRGRRDGRYRGVILVVRERRGDRLCVEVELFDERREGKRIERVVVVVVVIFSAIVLEGIVEPRSVRGACSSESLARIDGREGWRTGEEGHSESKVVWLVGRRAVDGVHGRGSAISALRESDLRYKGLLRCGVCLRGCHVSVEGVYGHVFRGCNPGSVGRQHRDAIASSIVGARVHLLLLNVVLMVSLHLGSVRVHRERAFVREGR